MNDPADASLRGRLREGLGAIVLLGQVARRPRPAAGRSSWLDRVGDPRNGVFLVLALALLIGGGRKWLLAMRARRVVDRLAGDAPALEDIAESATHRRSALPDLFRLLSSSSVPEVRAASGRALSRLWADDQLVTEEEQAIVVRGFVADWKARRRYPRGLGRPIPMTVEFGVPFLDSDGPGVGADALEWSWKVTGANRASLEADSPGRIGPGRAEIAIDPRDFPGDGPHRLVFHCRVKTRGLTSSWERELPQVPFSFEFDPLLSPSALFTLPDDVRGEEMNARMSLVARPTEGGGPPYLPLNAEFAVREQLVLEILPGLPCDVAHAIALEIEGIDKAFSAGSLSLAKDAASNGSKSVPIVPRDRLPGDAIERPGERRFRVVLTADPHLAWSDPSIRSAWPGDLVSPWIEVGVVRL